MSVYKKLLALQSDRIQVAKSCKANLGGGRVYEYASLDDVLAESIPALNKVGLVLTQNTINMDGVLFLETRIIDTETDTEVTSHIPLPGFTKWHDFGSAMTYSRRYALSSMLGIASDTDDDAHATMDSHPQPLPKLAPKPAAAPQAPPKPLLFKPLLSELRGQLLEAGFDLDEESIIGKIWDRASADYSGDINSSTPDTVLAHAKELARLLNLKGKGQFQSSLTAVFNSVTRMQNDQ